MALNLRYSWTPDLRMFLIKQVEPRERLWKKHPNIQNDNWIRTLLWKEVQSDIKQQFDLDIEVEDIKKAWKNLKDNYVRMTKITGEAHDTGRGKWAFHRALRYLDDSATCDPRNFGGEQHLKDLKITYTREEFEEYGMVQVSIPEVDNRITHNQLERKDVIKLTYDHETDVKARQIVSSRMFHKIFSDNNEENNTEDVPTTSIMFPSIKENQYSFKAVTCVDLSSFVINEAQRNSIITAILKLRGVYHKMATENFMRKGTPAGGLMSILDDFDDYIYTKEQIDRPSSIEMMLSDCSVKDKTEYEKMFQIIERYRDQLDMKNPASRWERKDTADKPDGNYSYGKRKPRQERLVQLNDKETLLRQRMKIVQTWRTNNMNKIKSAAESLENLINERDSQVSVLKSAQINLRIECAKAHLQQTKTEERKIQNLYDQLIAEMDNYSKKKHGGQLDDESCSDGELQHSLSPNTISYQHNNHEPNTPGNEPPVKMMKTEEEEENIVMLE